MQWFVQLDKHVVKLCLNMGCDSYRHDHVLLQGLEKEYDRLLQENDDLKRKLSRHDSSATYQASNKRD